MAICYIVGAGDFTTHFTPTDADLVIAADGGYDALKNAGIRCDLLIGDLDSINEVPTGVEIIRRGGGTGAGGGHGPWLSC